MFRLHVLGSPNVLGPDGAPVPLLSSQPKLLGLLAYLMVPDPGGSRRRDTLLAMFWPELDDAGARHALSQALSVMRRHLGPEVMDGKWRDRIVVSADALWCDAAAFRLAAEQGRDEEALRLYTGPLLDGLNVSDAADFERWVDQERRELTRLAVRTALRLCGNASDPAAACHWARQATRLDPYDEVAWRQLLAALDAGGDRAAALAEYERLQRRLHQDLEVAPSPETRRLIEAIRAREPVPGAGARHEAPGDADRTPGSEPGTATLTGKAPAVAAVRSPGRRAVAVFATVLVVGALAGIAASSRWDRLEDVLGQRNGSARIPILMATFESDATDSSLVRAAMVAFRADLTQSARVRLLDEGQVDAALRRMGRTRDVALDLPLVRELAIREGVPAIATGGVTRAGNGYIITGRIVSAKEGRDLFAVRQLARDSSDLITAIDRVSRRVRQALGESAELLRAEPPLEHVTTTSLDALRFYSDAERAATTDGALVLLDLAIAHDSTFAMAYWKQATIYSAWGPESKRIQAVEKAWSLREHLPEPERSYAAAAYYRAVAKDQERALAVWLSLLARDPSDKEALFSVTDIYMRRHDWPRAWHYAGRAVVETHEGVAYYNAFVVAVARGDFAAAQSVLDDLTEHLPEFSLTIRLRGELAAARRSYAEAEHYFTLYRDRARPGTMDRAGANAMLALTAEVRGRIEEAKAHLRRDLDESAAIGPAFSIARTLQLAALMARHSGEDRGARFVREVLAAHPLESLPPADRPYGALAQFHLTAGDTAWARMYLEQASSGAPVVSPGLEMARGNYVAAVDAYRERLSRAPAECTSCGMYELAHAYDVAGHPDSALSIYARAVATPGSRSIRADAEWLAPALQRLAELHQERDDPGTAANYYGMLLQLYDEGDANVRPRVQRAARELALLGQPNRALQTSP